MFREIPHFTAPSHARELLIRDDRVPFWETRGNEAGRFDGASFLISHFNAKRPASFPLIATYDFVIPISSHAGASIIKYLKTLKELNMNNPRCNRGACESPKYNNPEGVEDMDKFIIFENHS